MKKITPKTMATFDSPIRNSMSPAAAASPAVAGLLISLLLVCFGFAPMAQAVGPDTDGTIPGSNNGEGSGVLVNLTNGIWNTGTGFQALNHRTGGNQNTATGLRALFSDTNGGFNTATGVYSLFSNTSGFFNSATGAYSLANNTEGNSNTADGYSALYYNTEGDQNTATGYAALYRNTTGNGNTANGYQALNHNATGNVNTANGNFALANNTTGNGNTANGYAALALNSTGGGNIALGTNAGINLTTGSSNIDIGHAGFADESSTIRIGNGQLACYISGIYGHLASGGTAVYINSDWKLGTTTSSRRFKEEIKPMEGASEVLFALKPVSFRYKKGIDPQGIPQFGLVAEDVEAVNPDLVVRDKEGKVNTVRYDAVNAMLLNEFLKEHKRVEEQNRKLENQSRKIQEQQTTVAELKSTVAQQQKEMEPLTAQLKEQAAQIQKMSAQLEVSKFATGRIRRGGPAPRTVVSD